MKPATISLFSFLLVLLTTLAGCDRGEPAFPARIAGKALNLATNLPEPGVLVEVQLMDSCNVPSWPECWKTLASGITNDQGYFDIAYVSPSDNITVARLGAKGSKEGFFDLADSRSVIHIKTDSTIIGMFPKTYLRVRIEDEYPYDYSKYVGMKLSQTVFVPWDTVIQYPIDTVVTIEANSVKYAAGYSGLIYALVYDRPNTVGANNYLPLEGCPPHDTCEVEIRF